MPEMHFRVRWPDGSKTLCYSPSRVIQEFFNPGQSYELNEFIARSRESLAIASERVRRKYGFACTSAMSQLGKIETIAARFATHDSAQVWVEEFIDSPHAPRDGYPT